jgi:ribosome-associated toxin RatA of RatAB toxin-antitoxin module
VSAVASSVVVDAPLRVTFDVSNRLEDWPAMMEDYTDVQILRREGVKVWFRLTTADGPQWVSWRVIHPNGAFALAERHEPRAPFRFMQHVWTYRELSPDRTEMSWEMTFELDDEDRALEQAACKHLLELTSKNQARMKAYIEAEHRLETRAPAEAALR